MKARVIFYCVAIAVLLATLAAIPSHATERRDPLLNQEIAQSSAPGHDSATKPTKSSRHEKKATNAEKQTHSQSLKDKTSEKNPPATGQSSK